MTIEIQTADDDVWNDYLSRTTAATAFHRAEALDVLATESNSTVHRLVGYKGEEPVGLFPVFTRQLGPLSVAFSPPPDLKIPYLGPLLCHQNGDAKRRLAEKRHRGFVDACETWLNERYGPRYVTAVTAPGYEDVRPFSWNGYDAVPRYTYAIDLDRDRDRILSSFSRSARRHVRDDYDVAYEIREAGPSTIDRIVSTVAERHAEQDERFPIGADFITALRDALPEGAIRPFVCRVDGEFAGGHVVVEHGDTAILWLNAPIYDADVPASDLLVWRYVACYAAPGVHHFDLAGANLRRLSKYKAKFNPDLIPYFRVSRSTPTMRVASEVYARLR